MAFTRDPSTGEHVLYGEYLTNAQGEDVVAGIRTPKPISAMARDLPKAYAQFVRIAKRLEKHYRDVQDMEFTIERGRLYMLQTRSGKRTAEAAVKIAVDMVGERLITKQEAVLRVEPAQVDQLLHTRLDPKAKVTVLATGLAASPGAAYGKAVFDADRAEALAAKGEKVILVRIETNPDDVHGMIAAQGVLTARGGRTSHAAVVARGMGKPCVAGAESVRVDLAKRQFTAGGTTVKEGEYFTIDGSTGRVIAGQVAMIDPEISGELKQLLRWADSFRRMEVWANGDYPHDAVLAREFGAQGIGLCRTEHMFMEQSRLPVVQKMILAGSEKERRAELAKLLPFQREDFKGILRAMKGLPVVIRLIDPPLHEFLPSLEDLLVEVTTAQAKGEPEKKWARAAKLLEAVRRLHEQNPMLGLRGCRLGLMFPEIIEMQVRAIIEASVELRSERVDVHPEIMIPLVGTLEELRRTRRYLEDDGDDRARRVPRQGRLQVRHHDRAAARRADRRRDRRGRGVLLLRHQRPDPDHVRVLARRRRGQVPAQVRRGEDPPGQPVRDHRPQRRRPADVDRRARGQGDPAGHEDRHLRRARRRPGVRSRSARSWASTTCPAPRTAFRWRAWRPRTRASRRWNATAERRAARSSGCRRRWRRSGCCCASGARPTSTPSPR